jgi:hypothetical protein
MHDMAKPKAQIQPDRGSAHTGTGTRWPTCTCTCTAAHPPPPANHPTRYLPPPSPKPGPHAPTPTSEGDALHPILKSTCNQKSAPWALAPAGPVRLSCSHLPIPRVCTCPLLGNFEGPATRSCRAVAAVAQVGGTQAGSGATVARTGGTAACLVATKASSNCPGCNFVGPPPPAAEVPHAGPAVFSHLAGGMGRPLGGRGGSRSHHVRRTPRTCDLFLPLLFDPPLT